MPLNQREYSWEEKQVTELFQDFSKALSSNKSSYFLGTIVLTQSGDEVPEIADGQQRLATATILLEGVWFDPWFDPLLHLEALALPRPTGA